MSSEGNERLYKDLAWLWPTMSPPEDYVEEAETFARVIRERTRVTPRTLLHLMSGGGHLDHRMKRDFAITGVDVSPEMVGLARRLNPDVEYILDDVRSVRLGRTFDAVFIDDGVLYMLTEDDLKAAFETAFEHLVPGGVMLVYAESTPESFEQNRTDVARRASGDVELVYVENQYDPDTSDTTYETTFVYLIRQDGRLTVETDHHTCGIFTLDTWRRLLRDAGFDALEMRFEHSEFPEGSAEPMFACLRP
ncbi:MAG: class I SAM-dependent methyltransferase [Candidatus Eisenbacteria bacterium]